MYDATTRTAALALLSVTLTLGAAASVGHALPDPGEPGAPTALAAARAADERATAAIGRKPPTLPICRSPASATNWCVATTSLERVVAPPPGCRSPPSDRASAPGVGTEGAGSDAASDRGVGPVPQ